MPDFCLLNFDRKEIALLVCSICYSFGLSYKTGRNSELSREKKARVLNTGKKHQNCYSQSTSCRAPYFIICWNLLEIPCYTTTAVFLMCNSVCRSPLPDPVKSVLEEGINLYNLHRDRHGRYYYGIVSAFDTLSTYWCLLYLGSTSKNAKCYSLIEVEI